MNRDSQLGGATDCWLFDYVPWLRLAALHLMSCSQHGGVHHFAITDEGRALWCSPAATQCITDGKLGFSMPRVHGIHNIIHPMTEAIEPPPDASWVTQT